MKTKILASTVLGLISSFAFAQSVNVQNEGTLNVAPTFCEMSSASKTPSCTISIQASQGSKVTTSFYLRQQAGQYEDSNYILDAAFTSANRNFTTNPLFADYVTDGVKQVRLIYTGKITPDMTSGEMYGRMIIGIEKPGSAPFMLNLPVYFSTAKGQKAVIASATVGTTNRFDGRSYPNAVTTLTVTNNGSGVFAINGISFTKKANVADYTYSDFAQLDANVLPHSSDTILIKDEKIAKQLQQAVGSTIILSSKRKTEYVEVAIGK